MASPYIGEIRMFAGTFAPVGWAFCDGAELPISGNDALFNLIGTTYGGDGVNVFALPDLRGRLPLHAGPGYVLGQTGGQESVALTASHMPPHSHGLLAVAAPGAAAVPAPEGNLIAGGRSRMFVPAGAATPLGVAALTPVGQGLAHDNLMPCLAVNFIISLFGVYPTPT
ncbi:phage tail protein [Mesoterricola silvestris]|uniref:Tail Collar domain-containing protein n=1 Tax=Mesoterricola silvestris TaxID=2927979 RepID=A0AA48H4Y7_9BACT|nr:tail fiber protein [Mesoterricola silvestris]BDU71958.1 tail Collar domain-containing protein [Mesoterricola silvestris]